MTGAAEYVTQADALLKSDLSGASVDVRSLAATYKSRQKDAKAYAFARALVRRATAEGIKVSSSGGMNKAQLEAEVERRGLTVEGTGSNGNVTKGDLEAALKADDERAS